MQNLISAWLTFASAGSLLAQTSFEVENLGAAERQARIRGHALSLGTADYPARLLIGFVDGDGAWIVNLEDGGARRADSPGFDEDYIQWPSFTGADGMVFTSCGKGGLAIFDPVADTLKLVRPIEGAWWLRGLAIGPSGSVFVSDYPTGSAAKYDPKTGQITNFGPQGGPFDVTHVYGYSVGSDGQFVYTAAGKMPWRVVALDTKTGKQQVLMEFDPGDHPEVHQRAEKVFLHVQFAAPKPGAPAEAVFQLAGGKAEPSDALPRFDDSYVPGDDRPQPEVEAFDRGLPILDDGAHLRFRGPGEETWKTAVIPVAGNDMMIERIAPLANGQLLVAAGPYGNVHYFDPATGKFSRIGSPAEKNVYDLLEIDGVKYFCGYPNSIIGILEDDGGRLIGDWHESLKSKHANFLVPGADGRLYSGNHNERESTGGALGWFDPKTSEFGGIHFPNDDCEFLTTALDRRYIVYASDFTHNPATPEITKRSGRLIVYDTAERKIVRQVAPLSDGSAGVLVETTPGKMLGFGQNDKLPVLYTFDVETGAVGELVTLPAKAPRFIARGPDGKVYFFVKDQLVRADPETLVLEAICPAAPGRMAFVGNDLYLGGTSQLRRVRGVGQ